jgi:hypothetical protein
MRSQLLTDFRKNNPNDKRCTASVKTVARAAGHDLQQFETMTKDQGYAYSDEHLLKNKALVSAAARMRTSTYRHNAQPCALHRRHARSSYMKQLYVL